MSPASFLRVAFLLPVVVVVFASCAKNKVGGDDAEEIVGSLEEVDHPDAVRLTNGLVKVVVAPSAGGRILHYGFVGEKKENALWVNPDKPSDDEKWRNYGGDKAWPWPQDEWPLRLGRRWPPPDECDRLPLHSRVTGALSVRLTSDPIAGYHARLVREITLDPDGTRVTIVTRFERVASEELPPTELAAWNVTQIPTGKIYARMAAGGAGVGPLAPHPAWTTTRPVAGRVVALDDMPQKAMKMGLDADCLASVKDDLLFVQRNGTAMKEPGAYRPFERAQVFVQDKQRYAELELTSPRKDLARDQTPELRVTWELLRAPKAWSDEDVAKVLSASP